MIPEIKSELIRLVKNSITKFKFTNKVEVCKLGMTKINELNNAFCDDRLVLEYLQIIDNIFEM